MARQVRKKTHPSTESVFVGRTEELALLRQLMESARGGLGSEGTGRTEVESLAGKGTEHLVAAGGIGTLQPGHPEAVVAASQKIRDGLDDTIQTESPVASGVLAFVDGRKTLEMGTQESL